MSSKSEAEGAVAVAAGEPNGSKCYCCGSETTLSGESGDEKQVCASCGFTVQQRLLGEGEEHNLGLAAGDFLREQAVIAITGIEVLNRIKHVDHNLLERALTLPQRGLTQPEDRGQITTEGVRILIDVLYGHVPVVRDNQDPVSGD